MECDLYADLELSGSEGEEDNVETSSPDTNQVEMDLMDEGLTSKFKPTAAPNIAPPPRVDIEVEKLKHEVATLKEENEILSKNLVLLYKTAHHVYALKDKELNNLKAKYDAMCFRRRDPTNPSALPAIAPRADRHQNADAQVPERSMPAPCESRQLDDQPKRPTMQAEFSQLERYAQMNQRSKPGRTGSSTEAAKTVEGDSVQSSQKSSDSKACDKKQESDASSDPGNAIRRVVSSNDHREDSPRRALHRGRDQRPRGHSKTPLRVSRSRSPLGSQCQKERRTDRKRARGSSDEEHGAKRTRNEKPEAGEDRRTHRDPKTELKNLAVAGEVNARPTRSVKDDVPAENTSKNRGRELRENKLEDKARTKQSGSRSKREADASRKDGTDSMRAKNPDTLMRCRSDSERISDERSSGAERKRERSRPSRTTDTHRSPREDTRRNRTPDSRGSKGEEVPKHRNANSSCSDAVDRDSDRSNNISAGRHGGATRNRRTDSRRSEKVISERNGNNGASQAGEAGAPQNKRAEDRDRIPKRESRARDNNSTDGIKRDDRRPSSVSSRRHGDKSLGRTRETGSQKNGSTEKKRSHVVEEKPYSKDSGSVEPDAAIDEVADSLEDGEIPEENTPVPQQRDQTRRTRSSGAASTPEQRKTASSKVVVEAPQGTRPEKLPVKRKESIQDVSTSRRTQPGCSSKPASESEKDVTAVLSDTPTGVQDNQCDSPPTAGAQETINSMALVPFDTALRRSPRKCLRTERDAMLQKVTEEGAPEVMLKQICGSEEASMVKTWGNVPAPASSMSLPEFTEDISRLRRSPRKSVRDRRLLKSLTDPQAHVVVKSPQVRRPSPIKLRKIPAVIPVDPAGVTADPRVRSETVRPMFLKTISYSTSNKVETDGPRRSPLEKLPVKRNQIDQHASTSQRTQFDCASKPTFESEREVSFNRPATLPLAVVRYSSPRRSPRKLQSKKLTEGDAALLQSLLEPPRKEHPSLSRSESSSTSLNGSLWLDDLPCDSLRAPETPGKNLDLSEFKNAIRQNPALLNR